jgi:hypothetical protein
MRAFFFEQHKDGPMAISKLDQSLLTMLWTAEELNYGNGECFSGI